MGERVGHGGVMASRGLLGRLCVAEGEEREQERLHEGGDLPKSKRGVESEECRREV